MSKLMDAGGIITHRALLVLALMCIATPEATAQVVPAEESAPSAAAIRQWGEETLTQIREDFWLAERRLYTERAGRRRRRGRGRNQPAFMWGAGVQLTALVAAARTGQPPYPQWADEYIESLNSYWIVHDDVGGYDVQPNPRAPDRYYDDNAWIVLALVEAYELTGDDAHLARAVDTLRFVLSGEDDALGGGVYWREKEKRSKNTCSNAPTVVAALRVYQHTQDNELLETARRLYEWTCSQLQDDTDGLFWDNVALDGRIDRRKFSYNSALMIRANCLLHALTGEAKYLREAQRIGHAAEQHWIVPSTGAVRDVGRFAHLLLESLLALHQHDHDSHWLQLTTNSVVFVRDAVRDPNGRYPGRWENPTTDALRSYQLIDQASAARAYLVVAEALQNARNADPTAE